MRTDEILQTMLMYLILPLWLAAGFSDYLCHRAAHIERTSGWPESVLHLLEMAEMAIPVMAALFLEINAAVILLMIVCFLLHQATALWDLYYAAATREVGPIEQHVHSFLEMIPLMGLLLVVALHWDQFISLFGFASPRFDFVLKPRPLPWIYVATVLGAAVIFEILPYLEELWRGRRARRATREGGIVSGIKNKLQAAAAHVIPAERMAEKHSAMAAPGTSKKK